MTNPLINELIAQAHDLDIQWENLVSDRDGWKQVAERQRLALEEKIGAIIQLSDKLNRCQNLLLANGLPLE